MHTEGFENLDEAESESHRTYRNSSETDRLLRENEKLRKSLEKEKFSISSLTRKSRN
jgi:predicted RNase H-like nuclease (RuvC/YqgF family)